MERQAPRQDHESPHETSHEAAHESAPVHESRTEPVDDYRPPMRAEPKHVYTQAAPPPVAFKAVIQHDDAEEQDAHRPQRKRRHASDEANQPQQLQLVETQAEAAPLPAEDEPAHRTKPRRRRSGPVEAEPLMLVETQPNADAQRGESPPTP